MYYARNNPQRGRLGVSSKADLRAQAEAAVAAWRDAGKAPVVIPAEGQDHGPAVREEAGSPQ